MHQIVLQCLYSQCHTAQFGSALHHTLFECTKYPPTSPDHLPPLLRHQGLRKRAINNLALASARPLASAHQAFASAQAIPSVPHRNFGPSAAANFIRPTRSAYFTASRTISTGTFATKAALPSGLDDVGYNESLAPFSVSTGSILPFQTSIASIVSGSDADDTKSRLRLGKASISSSSASVFPTPSSLNSSQVLNNLKNEASMSTAPPPKAESAASYGASVINTSASYLPLPSATQSALSFNATTSYQKTPRIRRIPNSTSNAQRYN